MLTTAYAQNVLGAVLLLLPVFSIAQSPSPKSVFREETFGFYFNQRQRQQRIPFDFRSNLIIISAQINGADTARFIVDTGVSYTIITDPAVLCHPMPSSRTIRMLGVGESGTLTASVSTGNTIRLGNLQADHSNLIILSEDLLRLSEYAGVPIHGIIGYELFADLVVTLDFERQEIWFTEPGKYRYRPRKGARHPITILDKKVYVDAISAGTAAHPLPLRVVLDTGAGQALLLDRFQPRSVVPVPDVVVRRQLGRGLNGCINGELGRLSSIYLGHQRINDVLVSYPDSSNFSQKLSQLPQRQGSIGCELLRRFRVTLNYPAGYMVLKPIKRLLREPFEYNMSGLELRARGNGFQQYFIDQVAAGSPGHQAGLLAGDELLIVNNVPSSRLTLSDIFRMLQAGEGKFVSVLVKRRNQLIESRFKLKRII